VSGKSSGRGGALARVRHDFPAALTPGRLIRRYQRFLTEVELADGSRVTAHCNNSGTLLTCLEPGAPVYLSPSLTPGRRTAFTWEMIFVNGGWVGVNTLLPNRLVAEAARQRALPLFAGARAVRTEVKTGPHTRLDLVVERPQGPLYVEVKNVTLVRAGLASFPDAVSTRGAKHLAELVRLTEAGQEAAMVYVVQRSDAQAFTPAADIDPAYAEAFARARTAGVGMAVVQAEVSPGGVGLRRELPLAL
jgi:sugar fermentation stimulation protein A